MIDIRPFNGLSHANHGWLDARHHFSFANSPRANQCSGNSTLAGTHILSL